MSKSSNNKPFGSGKSLTNQGNTAIYRSYKPGMDKHSDMKLTESGGRYLEDTHKIYSHKSRDALLGFVAQAMPFIKARNPHIRLIKDIPVSEWNEFLSSKSATCSTASLKNYAKTIRKLERCVNYHFYCKVDWTTGLVVPNSEKTPNGERLRDKQIELEDYEACLAHATKPGKRSRAPIGWEITRRFGPRVSGDESLTVRDVRLDKKGRFGFGQLHVCEKGGRHRMIDIRTADDREFLEKCIAGKKPDDPLVGIKADAINRAMNRTMKALGMKEKYEDTSVHGLRKLFAQSCWDSNRENGVSYKENVSYLNLQLGHSASRDVALLRVYVCNLEKY